MNGLDDRVGGGCVWSSTGTSNAGFGGTELEDVVFKFGTSVVNDTLGTRVSGEPMVLEEATSRRTVGSAGLVETYDLNKTSDRSDHCQSIELHGVSVDFDDPRTDVIDVDFGPRGHGCVARSKLTLRSLSGVDLRTRSALGNDVTDNVLTTRRTASTMLGLVLRRTAPARLRTSVRSTPGRTKVILLCRVTRVRCVGGLRRAASARTGTSGLRLSKLCLSGVVTDTSLSHKIDEHLISKANVLDGIAGRVKFELPRVEHQAEVRVFELHRSRVQDSAARPWKVSAQGIDNTQARR